MSIKYSDKLVTELREIGSFNHSKALLFAELYGFPVRSVIAKVKALGLPYETKQKTATPGRGAVKEKIVHRINELLGQPLRSISLMTNSDLEKLEKILGEKLGRT